MYEVYFSVSLNGKFLFRTDWDDSFDRNFDVEVALSHRFPKKQGFKISRTQRSKIVDVQEVNNEEVK
jgi:hypothetical protein